MAFFFFLYSSVQGPIGFTVELASALEFKGHYWTGSAYGYTQHPINLNTVWSVQFLLRPSCRYMVFSSRQQHGPELNEKAQFAQINMR